MPRRRMVPSQRLVFEQQISRIADGRRRYWLRFPEDCGGIHCPWCVLLVQKTRRLRDQQFGLVLASVRFDPELHLWKAWARNVLDSGSCVCASNSWSSCSWARWKDIRRICYPRNWI